MPPTQCPLLTDFPFLNMVLFTNRSHEARIVVPSLSALTFLVQTISADSAVYPPNWRTSNGVKLVIP